MRVKRIGIVMAFIVSIIGWANHASGEVGYEGAAEWLRANQNADGSWGEGATAMRDTMRAVEALQYYPAANEELGKAKDWFLAQSNLGSDELAMKIIALKIVGEDISEFETELKNRIIEIGMVPVENNTLTQGAGFPHLPGERMASFEDTLLAMIALTLDREQDLSWSKPIMDYLISKGAGNNYELKDADTFFRYTKYAFLDEPSLYDTALNWFPNKPVYFTVPPATNDARRQLSLLRVSSGTAMFGELIANIIEKDERYDRFGLKMRRYINESSAEPADDERCWNSGLTGFEENCTFHETALVYIALAKMRRNYQGNDWINWGASDYDYAKKRRYAYNYISRKQSENGDWNGNAYDTALGALAVRSNQYYQNVYVDADTVSFYPTHIVQGNAINVKARIYNDGDYDLTTTMSVYSGLPLPDNSNRIAVSEDLFIEANSSVLVTLIWDTTGHPIGEHDIYMVANAEKLFPEFNENDNTAKASAYVNTQDMDLQIQSASYEETLPIYPYVRINATVFSAGGLKVNKSFKIAVYDREPDINNLSLGLIESSIVMNPGSLASGATKEFQLLVYKNDYPGARHFYLYVDYENNVTEGIEDNNDYDLGDIVVPIKLAVQGLEVDHDAVNTGDIVSMSTKVKYEGREIVPGDIVVRFYDGDPLVGGNQIGSDQIISQLIDGQESEVVTQSFDTSFKGGVIKLFVTANFTSNEMDYIDRVRSDNKAHKEIVVVNSEPDLSIKILNMEFIGMAAENLGIIDVKMEARNLSNVVIQGFAVNLYEGDSVAGDAIGLYSHVGDIATAEAIIFSTQVNIMMVDGTFNVSALISDTTPTDMNATNNVTYSYLKYGASKKILFDESHNPSYTIDKVPLIDDETGEYVEFEDSENRPIYYGGYMIFAEEIRKAGYEVNRTIKGDVITDDILKGVDVFVMLQPRLAYQNSELDAIYRYVENGGRLFFIGDWNVTQGYGIRNKFANYYGLSVIHNPNGFIQSQRMAARVYRHWPEDETGQWNDVNYYFAGECLNQEFSSKYNVNRVTPNWIGVFNVVPDYAISFMKSGSNANEWYETNRSVAVGLPSNINEKTGKGKVAFVLDLNILDNIGKAENCLYHPYEVETYPPSPNAIRRYRVYALDNLKFGLGIIEWLAMPDIDFKDLFVQEGDITLSKTQLFTGDTFNVATEVRRIGFIGENVKASYYLVNEEGIENELPNALIPDIRFGTQLLFENSVGIPSDTEPGTYRIKVVINEDLNHEEDIYNNNTALSDYFTVWPLPEPQQFVQTFEIQSVEYLKHQDVNITLNLENDTRYPFDATFKVSVYNSDGEEISPPVALIQEDNAVSFDFLESKTFSYSWNTGGNSPGDYTIKFTMLSATAGEIIDLIVYNNIDVKIVSDLAYAEISTDSGLYDYANDAVTVDYKLTSNAIEARDMFLTIRILDANGVTVENLLGPQSISFAHAGDELAGDIVWEHSNYYPSVYIAQIIIRNEEETLAIIPETPFTTIEKEDVASNRPFAFEVAEQPSISATFSLNQTEYGMTEDVTANLALESLNTLLVLEDLSIDIWFKDQDGNTAPVNVNQTGLTLTPNGMIEFERTVAAGHLGPGLWSAHFSITYDDVTILEGSKEFVVLSSSITGEGIVGEILSIGPVVSSDQVIKSGRDVRIRYSITNYSSITTIPAETPLYISIIPEETGEVIIEYLTTVGSSINWKNTIERNYTLDKPFIPPGKYTVVLTIQIDNIKYALAMNEFEVFSPDGIIFQIAGTPYVVYKGDKLDVTVKYANYTTENYGNMAMRLRFYNNNYPLSVTKPVNIAPGEAGSMTFTFDSVNINSKIYSLRLFSGSQQYDSINPGVYVIENIVGTIDMEDTVVKGDNDINILAYYNVTNNSSSLDYANVLLRGAIYDNHGNAVSNVAFIENTVSSITVGETVTGQFEFNNIYLPDGEYHVALEWQYAFSNVLRYVQIDKVEFIVDGTPPETIVKCQPVANKWVNTDVVVSFFSDDNILGVQSTLYCINTNFEHVCEPDTIASSDPITFSTEGKYQLCYYSIDALGNQENMKCDLILIDKTPPEAHAGNDIQGSPSQQLRLNALDTSDAQPSSGISEYLWDLNGDGDFEESGIFVNGVFSQIGEYTITLKVTDRAGNTSYDNIKVTVVADNNIIISGEPVPAIAVQYSQPVANYYVENLLNRSLSGLEMRGMIKPLDDNYKIIAQFSQSMDDIEPSAKAFGTGRFSSLNAPIGDYALSLYLFENGVNIAALSTSITVTSCANNCFTMPAAPVITEAISGNGGVTISVLTPTLTNDGNNLANIAQHNVYVSKASDGNYTQAGMIASTIPGEAIQYFHKPEKYYESYCYVVTAVDENYCESEFSNEICVMTEPAAYTVARTCAQLPGDVYIAPDTPGYVNRPSGIAIGDASPSGYNYVYIADNHNNRVSVFDEDCNFYETWGEYGNQPGQFIIPNSVLYDSGNVYVCDSISRVQKFSAATGQYVDHGQVIGPWKMAMLPTGRILVATHYKKVVSYDPITKSVNESASFTVPDSNGVVFNPKNGLLYVSDKINHIVRAYLPDGTPQPTSNIGYGQGSQNGQLSAPAGLAVDSDGNIIVADTGNDRVQIFTTSNQLLNVLGGTGAGFGKLRSPYDVAVSPTTKIVWVADYLNQRFTGYSPPSEQ
ncbi:MAG TPA: PKD domain-containing protein [bacterium]|nr:PKD domain-containing protein [bacterium]